ncbi:MAG: polysaccharide deacetylase family protein, partial [Clostridia bacterium]|nr:polysaccharide deacetylase family protein [Clostridia bacterium]
QAGSASEAEAPTRPVYYVVTRSRVMALTFDISWGTQAVGEVLAVLRDYRQPATFFLSGPWSSAHPEIVRRIAKDGHEIASHGEAHVNLSRESDAAIAENLATADAVLTELAGRKPRFFRPPNGDFDARVVRIAALRGEETVIWSIDSLDWLRRDPDEIARRVVAGAFPGAIILFHASDSAPATAAALPRVFRELGEMGYRLLPLGELLAYGPPAREDPRGRPYKPNMAGAGR